MCLGGFGISSNGFLFWRTLNYRPGLNCLCGRSFRYWSLLVVRLLGGCNGEKEWHRRAATVCNIYVLADQLSMGRKQTATIMHARKPKFLATSLSLRESFRPLSNSCHGHRTITLTVRLVINGTTDHSFLLAVSSLPLRRMGHIRCGHHEMVG